MCGIRQVQEAIYGKARVGGGGWRDLLEDEEG